MSLLNDIHKTNSGPIERALRDADVERIGQVGVFSARYANTNYEDRFGLRHNQQLINHSREKLKKKMHQSARICTIRHHDLSTTW